MNPTLGAILLGLLSLPIVFQLYFGFAINYIIAYILPSGVENNAEFDFIVVGAGSAGSVVAGRLAEAGHQVLLVEAGGPSNWIQSIPALVLASQGTPYDWGYKTEPQEHTMYALNERRSAWPRGKVLGGSSILNYMLYVRGNPKDYDEWESLGNPGWKYEDVLPYFKKSENYHRSEADPKYHGTGGPLGVMEGADYPEISRIFLEAGKEMGYTVGDYNGERGNAETLYIGQMSVQDGKRTGTYKAFAEPFVGKGLTVLTHALVTKVLIDAENIAHGIEAIRFGQKFKLNAKKEIVLSGGAIGSSQILLLSGIGPGDHLRSLKISVIQDLPGVGQNLQDHLFTTVGVYSKNKKRISQSPFDAFNFLHYANYLLKGSGPLTSNGAEIGGFFSTKMNTDKEKRPDLQLHTIASQFACDYGLKFKTSWNIEDGSFKETFGQFEGNDGALLNPSLLRPKSRGYIQLKSLNPNDAPIIQPNYLSESIDFKTLEEGVKLSLNLLKTNVAKENEIYHIVDTYNCGNFSEDLDKYIECYVKHWTFTIYHPVGTCKMGTKVDNQAVVDEKLRVYGIKSLRVVDASIMPTLVSGNTNAPAIMIGEKGADMIIEEWKNESNHVDHQPKSEL